MYAKHKSTEKFGYKVKNVNKIENDSGAFPSGRLVMSVRTPFYRSGCGVFELSHYFGGLEEAGVEVEIGLGGCADVEAGGAFAAAVGCLAAQGGVFKQVGEDCGESFGIAFGEEKCGASADFTDSAHVRGHKRCA